MGKKDPPKNKGGRPSKYEGIDLTLLGKLARAGLTDKQMSAILEISEETFNQYKKNQEFSESLKEGKTVADGKVVQALFERATGYSHPEDRIFCEKGVVTVVPTIKHHPPDTTACIFWLKNRDRGNWRDKVDHGLEGKDGEPLGVIIYPGKKLPPGHS